MKKLLLTLSSICMASAPIMSVISCDSPSANKVSDSLESVVNAFDKTIVLKQDTSSEPIDGNKIVDILNHPGHMKEIARTITQGTKFIVDATVKIVSAVNNDNVSFNAIISNKKTQINKVLKIVLIGEPTSVFAEGTIYKELDSLNIQMKNSETLDDIFKAKSQAITDVLSKYYFNNSMKTSLKDLLSIDTEHDDYLSQNSFTVFLSKNDYFSNNKFKVHFKRDGSNLPEKITVAKPVTTGNDNDEDWSPEENQEQTILSSIVDVIKNIDTTGVSQSISYEKTADGVLIHYSDEWYCKAPESTTIIFE